MFTPRQIEYIAGAAHEVNRYWCLLAGDRSQRPWPSAPNWQRESAMAGVQGVIDGNTPEESHALWVALKEADGWVYGELKDPDAKTHPCLVSYDELPAVQRYKDTLFVTVVQRLAAGAEGFIGVRV